MNTRWKTTLVGLNKPDVAAFAASLDSLFGAARDAMTAERADLEREIERLQAMLERKGPATAVGDRTGQAYCEALEQKWLSMKSRLASRPFRTALFGYARRSVMQHFRTLTRLQADALAGLSAGLAELRRERDALAERAQEHLRVHGDALPDFSALPETENHSSPAGGQFHQEPAAGAAEPFFPVAPETVMPLGPDVSEAAAADETFDADAAGTADADWRTIAEVDAGSEPSFWRTEQAAAAEVVDRPETPPAVEALGGSALEEAFEPAPAAAELPASADAAAEEEAAAAIPAVPVAPEENAETEGAASETASGEATEAVSETVSDEAAEEVSETVSGGTVEAVSETVSDQAAEAVSETVSDETMEVVSETVSDEAAEVVSETVSDEATEVVTETVHADPVAVQRQEAPSDPQAKPDEAVARASSNVLAFPKRAQSQVQSPAQAKPLATGFWEDADEYMGQILRGTETVAGTAVLEQPMQAAEPYSPSAMRRYGAPATPPAEPEKKPAQPERKEPADAAKTDADQPVREQLAAKPQAAPPTAASPGGAGSAAVSEEIRQIRRRYILGKIAGEDLTDRSGRVIIAKGQPITEAVMDAADREGKLAELIVNMVIQGLGDGL